MEVLKNCIKNLEKTKKEMEHIESLLNSQREMIELIMKNEEI